MNIIKVVTIYPEENINDCSNLMAIDPIIDMSVWTKVVDRQSDQHHQQKRFHCLQVNWIILLILLFNWIVECI